MPSQTVPEAWARMRQRALSRPGAKWTPATGWTNEPVVWDAAVADDRRPCAPGCNAPHWYAFCDPCAWTGPRRQHCIDAHNDATDHTHETAGAR